MTDEKQITNILQLPDEMILEIFSYIPKQLTVGLTCKKFYEISCDSKFFSLWLRSYFNNDSYNKPQVYTEEEIFESMINSKRRIRSIRAGAFFDDKKKFNVNDKMTQIIKHFGNDVKKIDIYGLNFNRDVLELLNFMPNLGELELSYMKESEDKSFDGLQLNLPNLWKLKSRKCSEKMLEVFNTLPAGVLEVLEIEGPFRLEESTEDFGENFELFKNQDNLSVLISNVFFKFIDLKKKKLEYLYMQSHLEYPENVVGQDKLLVFKTFGIYKTGLLRLVANEMKSLQYFKVSYLDDSIASELGELSKLKNLVKFRFDLSVDEHDSLSTLKGEKLWSLKMTIRFELRISTLASLGSNCPELSQLWIRCNAELNIINNIIKSCPNLVELVYDFKTEDHHSTEDFTCEAYTFLEGLKHDKLKKLKVYGTCKEYQDLPKLLKCCEKLEEFITVLPINAQLLEEILSETKLKRFDLQHHFICGCDDTPSNHIINMDFVNTLKAFGTNLTNFRCQSKGLEDDITLELLEEMFKDHFDGIRVNYGEKSTDWTMKKC